MELSDLIVIFKKSWKISITASVIVSLTVFFVTFKYGSNYTSQGTLLFESVAPEENDQKYTYGGYYSQQKAVSFSDNFVKLINSPPFLKSALEKSEIVVSDSKLRVVAKNVIPKKTGPQILTLTIRAKTSSEADSLWKSLAKQTQDEVFNISQISKQNYLVYSSPNSPVTTFRKVSLLTNPFGAFLLTYFSFFALFYTKKILKNL